MCISYKWFNVEHFSSTSPNTRSEHCFQNSLYQIASFFDVPGNLFLKFYWQQKVEKLAYLLTLMCIKSLLTQNQSMKAS